MKYNIRLSIPSPVTSTLVALGVVVGLNGGCSGSGGRFLEQQGGASTAGGTTSVGGTNITGGDSSSSGGFLAAGGTDVKTTDATGGVSATGGFAATGGSATVGSTTTGGMPGTGGTSSAAGSLSTGGSLPITGGAHSTGGSPSSGGAMPIGGTATTGGTPASGGNTATGGSSGVQHCTPDTMIDDMEDGDSLICPNQGRSGSWYTAGGKCESFVPSPNTVFNAMSIPGGRGSSLFAMHLTGTNTNCSTGYSDNWALLGASLAPDTGPRYNASQFGGVRFWAKTDSGNLKLRVNIDTTATRSQGNGGTCVPQGGKDCNDHYGTFVTVTNSWQQFSLNFMYITQSGWGVPAAKDYADLWNIEFVYYKTPNDSGLISTNPDVYSMWIDDLEFW